IVATIGPASRDRDLLTRMVEAGVDVARLNFSHGTAEQHAETCQWVRDAAGRAGPPVAGPQDLPGPQPPLGPSEGDIVELKPGDHIVFECGDHDGELGTAERMSITWGGLPDAIEPGEVMYLADGSVRLRATAVRAADHEFETEVEIGGSVA